MRNKKGFTLIELLAIIVILAIIAVITVPIILNIIENSKKGAATDSAYGYKDAIDKFYASKLSIDSRYNIPDGLHTLSDFDTMGVTVSGKKPASNSFLKTVKNKVIQGCLQYDEYKVEFIDGRPQNAQKGTCKTVNVVYVDVNENGKIDLADTVQIESDLFYIIDVPENGKVKLLPQYNLDENSRQSSSSSLEIHYGASDYWNGHLSNYPMDIYDTYYIYEKTSRNNIYSYAENYKEYLIGLGAYFVTDARSMSFMEAKKMGCKTHDESNYNRSCPSFAYSQDQGYWLGSATSTNWVYFIEDGNNGGYLYPNLNSASWGVRPLIEIYESAITNNYTLTFDSRGGIEVASKTIVTGEKAGTLPTNPIKEGAVFEGWYTDKDYTSSKLTSDTVPIGSTTYYARYVLSKAEYTDSDGSGTVNLGDSVKILDDYFYVMGAPSGGKVKLLAKYNLNGNSRQENGHNVSINFAPSKYWNSNYPTDSSGNIEIYRNNLGEDTANNLKTYMNNYKDYLTRQGAEFVSDVRPITYTETRAIGCKRWDESDYVGSCPTWSYNQGYWTGTTQTNDWIFYVEGGYSNRGYLYPNPHTSNNGVRAVIEISESAL